MSVLTSCQSLIKYTPAKVETTEVVKNFLPDMPVFPGFPNVTWSYIDGRYTLSEQDVDKILDYGENKIPMYLYELDQYEKKLQVILDSL